MTPASKARIDRFIRDFISSEYVSYWSSEKDNDFINEPDRASRVYDAAEFGADGKTHAEAIEDWREAFHAYVRYGTGRNGTHNFNGYPRFEAAVEAHFDACEKWHEEHGDLWSEIG